jgi:hypothetical protein
MRRGQFQQMLAQNHRTMQARYGMDISAVERQRLFHEIVIKLHELCHLNMRPVTIDYVYHKVKAQSTEYTRWSVAAACYHQALRGDFSWLTKKV